jgi:hypothetical protein
MEKEILKLCGIAIINLFFLSLFDHLPISAFASYSREPGDKQKEDSYLKAAEKAWERKRSVHSIQCKQTYFSDTEKDDVIPKGLLDYITPVFNVQAYGTN